MNIETDYKTGKIKIVHISKEEKKHIKRIRNEIKILEKSLIKHLEKHRRETILRNLE